MSASGGAVPICGNVGTVVLTAGIVLCVPVRGVRGVRMSVSFWQKRTVSDGFDG